MKKTLKIFGVVVFVLAVLFIVSIPIVNNHTASRTASRLAGLPLPEDTELIETVSAAGKLVGNGNGMQFFGAMLIKSELTIVELNSFYAAHREREWDCIVETQTEQKIGLIEHGTLSFSHSPAQDEGYYIVYSWGNGIEPFCYLDIRGH